MRRFVAPALLLLLLAPSGHAGDGRERLGEVLAASRPGQVMVFDLDDTLFDSGDRTARILRDFFRQPSFRRSHPILSAHVRRNLAPRHVAYRLSDTMANIGLGIDRIGPLLGMLDEYWIRRFFTSLEMLRDEPNPGAVEFVTAAHRRGVTIVYLTGRERSHLGAATRLALRRAGFPLGERVHLFLKPDLETDTLAHKRRSFPAIRALGEVVALFDNEPANVVAAVEPGGLPDAIGFFMDTRQGGPLDLLVGQEDVHWLTDFHLPGQASREACAPAAKGPTRPR